MQIFSKTGYFNRRNFGQRNLGDFAIFFPFLQKFIAKLQNKGSRKFISQIPSFAKVYQLKFKEFK